jgi:hypothetical protein
MTPTIAALAGGGKRLVPGTLNLVLRAGGCDLGAIIHPTNRRRSFAIGEARAAQIARRNPGHFEQRLLRHIERHIRASADEYEALGGLATWLLINSDEWPFLKPYAEAGKPVIVVLERQSGGKVRLFFDLPRFSVH